MGYNNYTYIGFYFKVKHKTVETTEEKITYETPSGEVFDEYTNFSSNTGEATKVVTKQITKQEVYKDLHDLADLIKKEDEDYYFDNYMCSEFAPNPKDHTLIFLRNFEDDEYYGTVLDEDDGIFDFDFNLDPAYSDFMVKHKVIYDDLVQVFGKADLHYGVFNYSY